LDSLSDRQREIVEASIRLISKGGIQKLTTKNLAAELGFSEPALYRHFKSKQAILLAILGYFRAQQQEMYTLVSASEPSPFKALGKIIGQVFRAFSAKPILITIVFAEGMFQNDARLSKVVHSILEDRRKQFASLISEAQERREIRLDADKDQLAHIIIGSIRMLITRWRLSDFTFDLVKEGEKCIGTLRRLLK
jgi:TetR/AcrR family transcriptional regulator, fatty acid metabolism regulator protein